MLDHRGDLLAADQKRSEQMLGESCFAEDLLDCKGAPGHIGCVFQHGGVPGHEPWRGEAEHLPEREIPWHDGQNDA